MVFLVLRSDYLEMSTSCGRPRTDFLGDSLSHPRIFLMLLGVFTERGRPL